MNLVSTAAVPSSAASAAFNRAGSSAMRDSAKHRQVRVDVSCRKSLADAAPARCRTDVRHSTIVGSEPHGAISGFLDESGSKKRSDSILDFCRLSGRDIFEGTGTGEVVAGRSRSRQSLKAIFSSAAAYRAVFGPDACTRNKKDEETTFEQ